MADLTRTTPHVATVDDCGDRCRDFDEDCYGINDKLHCWKYDPTKGVCPFLTGDVIDE